MTDRSGPATAAPAHVGVVQVLVGASLFGTVGVARTLGPDAPAAAVGGARVAVAAAVLVPLAAWSVRRFSGQAVATRGWTSALRRRSVWVAGLAQAAFQATFLTAVLLTGVATGTLVAIGSVPLFAGLLHRRFDRPWVVSTAVGVTGLVLLVAGGSAVTLEPTGALLALAAGFSYATYTVSTGSAVRNGVEPTALAASAFVVAAVVLAPALLLTDTSWLRTPAGWALVGWLALGATVASYLLIAHGLRAVSPPVAATLGLAEPVVATVLAVVILHERPTPVGWVGAGLVVLGLAGAALGARRTVGRRVAVRGSTP